MMRLTYCAYVKVDPHTHFIYVIIVLCVQPQSDTFFTGVQKSPATLCPFTL
jgi:hypothetical protein